MRENLHRFFRAARGAGVRVSPAESIDAMRAVSKIGFNDRQILRDTFLVTLAKTQEEKSRRDIALTHSYTSEEEIDFARSRALLAIESQLKAAETYIADLTKRQQELKRDKLAYGTKPVPGTLDTELTGIDEELARQDKVLAQRRAEIAAINAKYESDKQRWREIRAIACRE